MMKSRKKNITISLIGILWAMTVSCSDNKPIKRITYIFPQDYSGNAVIFFKQYGNTKKDSICVDELIYEFPRSGILLTGNPSHLTNMQNSKYYYKDSTGELSELSSLASEISIANSPTLITDDYLAVFGNIEYGVISVGVEPKNFDIALLIDSLEKSGGKLKNNIRKKYKYGFNGQEMSNEIKGIGNSYTAEFWEYNPRLGLGWNLDPVWKSGSIYSALGNNPVLMKYPFGNQEFGDFASYRKHYGDKAKSESECDGSDGSWLESDRISKNGRWSRVMEEITKYNWVDKLQYIGKNTTDAAYPFKVVRGYYKWTQH